jgi:hypothetical protein
MCEKYKVVAAISKKLLKLMEERGAVDKILSS